MKTTYLNIDLDLVSSLPMNELIACFEESCTVLIYQQSEDGKWHASIELEVDGEWEQAERFPENNIQIMVELILSFTGELLRQWAQCEKREFNLGYKFGETRCFQQSLSEKLVKQIAQVNGSLGITLYNLPDESAE